MKLIIIRHGQTDGNVDGIVQGSGVDFPLNNVGREQALSASERLKVYQLPIIYCSRMKRAQETAEIIAKELACPVEVVDGLQEVNFGEAEGMLCEDVYKKYAEIFSIIDDKNNPRCFNVAIPQGESINECIERSLSALREISQTCPYNIAAVVTHGALMYNLYYYFFKISKRFHNCEFFEIEL